MCTMCKSLGPTKIPIPFYIRKGGLRIFPLWFVENEFMFRVKNGKVF